MAAKNHPYFFPLLKKLLIVGLKRYNTDKISASDKEMISQKSGISRTYADRILSKGVYSSKVGQTPIGIETLNKLVSCLPEEWGYQGWDAFCHKEQERMNDKRLIYDLKDDDFQGLGEQHQNRIRKEIEMRAIVYLETFSHNSDSAPPISESKAGTGHPEKTTDPKNDDVIPLFLDKINYHKWIWRVGLGLSIFAAVWYFLYITPLEKQKKEIVNVVRQSIVLEFEAYRNVDRHHIYIQKLAKILYPNYLRPIGERLVRCYKKGWTLRNPDNTSVAMDLEVIFDRWENDSIAYVNTKEYWLIHWYDQEAQKYVYKYDVINSQQYILKQSPQGEWKIFKNNYQGNAPKSIPQNHSYEDLRSLVEISFARFQETVESELLQENIERAMALIRFRIRFRHPDTFAHRPDFLQIIQIEADFREAQTNLNLKKTTLPLFQKAKQKAIYEARKFLRQID